MDVIEKPHFRYRGLRYFAHRGLHRFQAEHWDLEDWQREIDWLLKKRFNLFMLRTGIDDLFQRAFPGDVPYPPTNAQDPDAEDRSYNDRTSFWPLKYRGELRKRVLQYAFDDFSMVESFRRLEQAKALGDLPATLNPHSEQTLKGNAENHYCRGHHYELARYVYLKEAAVFWDYVLKRLESGQRAKWGRPPESAQRAKAIEDEFFATPLAEMAPKDPSSPAALARACRGLEDLVRQYLASTELER
jgi:hypothetical protein